MNMRMNSFGKSMAYKDLTFDVFLDYWSSTAVALVNGCSREQGEHLQKLYRRGKLTLYQTTKF